MRKGQKKMKQWDALVEVAEKLLGPGGCPWDHKQTFASLRPFVLEEAHEVLEAVDLDDTHKIQEELGDLLYLIVFYGKLGESHKRFSLESILEAIREKLVRRHPHVFGDVKAETLEEIKANWDRIKAQEKGKAPSGSLLDGIPPTLPSLARAQKIVERIDRLSPFSHEDQALPMTEEEIGRRLLDLIVAGHRSGVNVEIALRRALSQEEAQFRHREANSG